MMTRSVVQTVHILEVLCIEGTPRDDGHFGSRGIGLDAEVADGRSGDGIINIGAHIAELFGQEACSIDGRWEHAVVDAERTLQAVRTSGDLLAVGLITCKQEIEGTEGVHLVVPSLGLLLTQ